MLLRELISKKKRRRTTTLRGVRCAVCGVLWVLHANALLFVFLSSSLCRYLLARGALFDVRNHLGMNILDLARDRMERLNSGELEDGNR